MLNSNLCLTKRVVLSYVLQIERTAYEKNRLHNDSNTVLLEYIRSKHRIYLIENRSGSESKDQ